MKTLLFLLSCCASATLLAQAPAPAKPATPAPRLTAKEIRVLPFCREFKEKKFKPNDRDLPDELRATVGAADIHLYGKKRGEVVQLQGRPTGHVGKVVLLPPGERKGRLAAKVGSAEEVTLYFAVLEMAEALETKPLKLTAGKNYDWTVKVENGQTTLRVLDGTAELAALSGPADGVKGLGFAATVRNKGNEADLLIALP